MGMAGVLGVRAGRSCARSLVGLSLVQALWCSRVGAEPPDEPELPSSAPDEWNARLQRLEQREAAFLEQNRQLAEQNRQAIEHTRALEKNVEDLSRRYEELKQKLEQTQPQDEKEDTSSFLTGGYDTQKGHFILVQPRDPKRMPLALYFNLATELRYTAFKRTKNTWTNSGGEVLPVNTYDTIEVVRNWFMFSGYALDPRLRFVAILFTSTTNNITLLLGGLQLALMPWLKFGAGYSRVPGSREWLESFITTLGADRTMSTTFFRPSISPGVWIEGELPKGFHYIAMVANSLRGITISETQLNQSRDLAFSGSAWGELFSDFGPGTSDIEGHTTPSLRFGSSFSTSKERLPSAVDLRTNPENTLLRLSDGTPVGLPGALGEGVTVSRARVKLWALDLAIKYRGFGLSAEYYLRWLNDFDTSGAASPIRRLFAHGAYVQGGYFAVPKQLEGFARYSYVKGRFGDGHECGGGVNWFPAKNRAWRATMDLTRIWRSPADNILTGYRAGESGFLVQVQSVSNF